MKPKIPLPVISQDAPQDPSNSPDLGRRRFLQGMGAAAAAMMTGIGIVRFRAEAVGTPAKPPGLKHRWGMVIDLRKCDGCDDCTEACREMHHLPEGMDWIKVYELEAANGNSFFMPRPCMQCANAPCLNVCPVGATFETDDGIILVDQDKCIGCRMCMAACPYNARTFNWTEQPPIDTSKLEHETSPEFPVPGKKGTVSKCVLCVHRLREGRLPGCVEACSMGALYIADWENDLATTGRETVSLSALLQDNDAFRFKEELNTQPRVYYIAGHGQDLDAYYSW